MLWLTIAASLASATADMPRQSGPVAQARATVRIVSGVRLRLGEPNHGEEAPPARKTVIRSGGMDQPARLIEFEELRLSARRG